MKVRNASRWAPRGVRGWSCAALALILASAVQFLLHPLLGPIMPGTAYIIAAALIGYFFGMAPALAVMGFGFLIADYLFVPPYQEIAVLDQSDVGLIVSLPLVSFLVVFLIERLRRSQFRAELIGLVAQSRYEMLLRADNERVMAGRAVDETHRLLRHLPHYHNDIVLIQALDRRVALDGSRGGRVAGPEGVAAATAPGLRYEHVHPDDIKRLLSTLTPGNHRARVASAVGKFKPVDCICEGFTTHAGDFLVLRVGD